MAAGGGEEEDVPSSPTGEFKVPSGCPGKESWEVVGGVGLGLHLRPRGIQGQLMPQDQMQLPKECAR